MLLVNIHILKIAVMLNAEYNRRATIIEGLRARHSATEIILWILEINYDVVAKYTTLELSNEGSSMPTRKSHSKNAPRGTHLSWGPPIKSAQTLISDDLAQSLRKLALIIVNQLTIRIAEKNLRYKSYTLKIRHMLSEAARTSRVAHYNLVFFEKRSDKSVFFWRKNVYFWCQK